MKYYDPETVAVEQITEITLVKAIDEIRDITNRRLPDDEKLYRIEAVLDEVE